MAEQPDSGNSGSRQPSYVLHRRELPPTRRERLLRIALRVVTAVLVVGALTDLVLRLIRNGH